MIRAFLFPMLLAAGGVLSLQAAENPASPARENGRAQTGAPALQPPAFRAKDGREKDRSSAIRREDREKWRMELRTLPAAEREARLKELRQKYGQSSPPRDERPKWREAWDHLSPAEREACLREWREQRLSGRPFTSEEREARRQQLRERLARQIADLRQKAGDGALSPEGTNRLERLEQVAQRFGSGRAGSASLEPPSNEQKNPPEKGRTP